MDLEKYIMAKILTAEEREKLNRYIKDKFNNSELKSYLSQIYPDIYPKYVGLILDIDGKFKWGFWEYNHIYDGYYEKGWNFDLSDKPLDYLEDILKFFKDKDTEFYNFLKRIGN